MFEKYFGENLSLKNLTPLLPYKGMGVSKLLKNRRKEWK
jgi:hypothetical protein